MHVARKSGVRTGNRFAAHIMSQLEHGVSGSCDAVAVEQRLQASSLVQLCQQDGPRDGGMPQQGDPGCLQADMLGMAAVTEQKDTAQGGRPQHAKACQQMIEAGGGMAIPGSAQSAPTAHTASAEPPARMCC